ncbi:MAG: hypothetical protein UT17_C0001G0013 [Candidatus Woesebacteria bacterium GW2011_GWB1_39_10]|uniref:Uncharacterized protein n=2 Tax=Candidatus Woeseibacteriota TaxID=1752722 RepID=A0A0G0UTX3_9BACT|nr:MAG: hypothetical protein UT17_C0001G0013 [Candidatus Woesebacteria bacterium GW2011_GWB1_39_10]KKR92199.1 MAG: hypothetical protein UU42_C0002G0013 [Candidatus Woesebacteria bacterium GW2011_GWA1_41_13b]
MTSTAGSATDPRVLITRKVLRELSAETLKYPNIETACGLVGMVLANGTIVIAGVIPPSTRDIVRRQATVKFGGEGLSAAVLWMEANFANIHKNDSVANFSFIWKKHSHHGLGYNHFSQTDVNSIVEAVEKYKMEFAIGILALIPENRSTVHTRGQMKGTVSVESDVTVRFRFYYFDRNMLQAGIREPKLVTPQVVDEKVVPVMPPLAWQWVDEDGFNRQLRQLEEYGARATPIYRDVNGDPIQEIQFVITKPNWKGTLLVTTNWDYPKTPPLIQVISDVDPTRPGKELHEVKLDADGKPIWTSESDFIDVVFELEKLEEL